MNEEMVECNILQRGEEALPMSSDSLTNRYQPVCQMGRKHGGNMLVGNAMCKDRWNCQYMRYYRLAPDNDKTMTCHWTVALSHSLCHPDLC